MYVENNVEKGEIAPEEQFLLLSTIFCYMILDFYVETRIRFSLRDKRLFEITEVEITRVDCICEWTLFKNKSGCTAFSKDSSSYSNYIYCISK